MRALFCATPRVAIKECGGVREVMRIYEDGLKAKGHEVEFLPPSHVPDWSDYDVCHLFLANGETFNLGVEMSEHLPLVVSPFIDKWYPSVLLRLNVLLDRYSPFLYTHVGRCAALCSAADALCLMSTDEQRLAAQGLGVRTPATVGHATLSLTTVEPEAGRFAEYEDKPFVLFLGDAGRKHKNVARLIKSMRGLDIELLIAAIITQGDIADSLRELIEATPYVRHIGIVKGGEKAFLLKHARVLALPSFVEGIGLAAVEAGLVGTTAVVSRNGGPRDYFGDKAYYVNPFSVADIRRKMKLAISHPLDASDLLQQFSVDRTGAELEACYEEAIERSKARTEA